MNHEQIKSYVAHLNPGFWGKFSYYFLCYRKRLVFSNLKQVFENILSPAEIKKLAQCFYGHLFRSLIENFKMSFMSQQQICDQGVVIGEDIPLALAKQGKGLAILTGHIGNWEFAPIAGISNFKAFQGRFHIVRKPQIKIIEQIFFRRYHQAGLHVIPKKNALNQICDALEKNDAVVFVMDQHALINKKEGIAVEFFDKKAGTYRTLASLVKYTDVPVIPTCCYRREDGKQVLHFFDPIPWTPADNPQDELYINTKAYNQALEKMILAHPEQWLWVYRRWKLKS